MFAQRATIHRVNWDVRHDDGAATFLNDGAYVRKSSYVIDGRHRH